MRIQEQKSSCGAASIINALRCVGKKVLERDARKLASTDSDGTTEEGVLEALNSLGFRGEVFETYSVKHIKVTLKKYLDKGQPLIIACDDDTHWAVVAGRLGERFIVIDSERVKRNIKENGSYVLSIRELLKRLRKPSGEMYIIAVQKK